MQKWQKRIFWLLGFVSVLLIMIAVYFGTWSYSVDPVSVIQQLSSNLNTYTDYRLTYEGKAHWSFTPQLKVEFKQVNIIPKEITRESIRIKKLELFVDTNQLLKRRLKIIKIYFHGLNGTIDTRLENVISWLAWKLPKNLHPFMHYHTDKFIVELKEFRGYKSQINAKDFKLTDLTFDFGQIMHHGQKKYLLNIDAKLIMNTSQKTLPLASRVILRKAEKKDNFDFDFFNLKLGASSWVGSLKSKEKTFFIDLLTQEFHLDELQDILFTREFMCHRDFNDNSIIKGRLVINKLYWHQLLLTQFKTLFSVAQQQTQFIPIKTDIAQGQATGALTFDCHTFPATWLIDLHVENAQLEEILSALKWLPQIKHGIMDLTGSIKWQNDVAGALKLEIEQGVVNEVQFNRVLKQAGNLFEDKPSYNFGLDDPEPFQFANLVANIELGGFGEPPIKLVITSPGTMLSGKGTIDLKTNRWQVNVLATLLDFVLEPPAQHLQAAASGIPLQIMGDSQLIQFQPHQELIKDAKSKAASTAASNISKTQPMEPTSR